MIAYKVGRCAEYSYLDEPQSVSSLAGTNLYSDLFGSTPIGEVGIKIFFPLDPPEPVDFYGPRPVTSKHDQRGDADCEHFNIKGSIVALPSGFGDKWITYRYKGNNGLADYRDFTSARYNEVLASTISTFPAKGIWTWFLPLSGIRCFCPYGFEQPLIFTPFIYSKRSLTGVSVIWHSGTNKYNYYCICREETNKKGVTDKSYRWYRLDTTFKDTYPLSWIATDTPLLPSRPSWTYTTKRSFSFRDLTSDDPSFDFQKIRSLVPRHPINRDYGPLCHRAFNDTKILSNNTLMYLSKLFTLPESGFSAISTLAKDPTLAHAASAFLMYDYGIRLSSSQTISTAESLRNFIKKEPRAKDLWYCDLDFSSLREIFDAMLMTAPNGKDYLTCRAMSPKTSAEDGKYGFEEQLFFKAYYRPYDNAFSKCYTVLNSLDVGISAENIWDAIPYSFVVDWFVSIGDYLSTCDTANYIYTLDILGCIMTQVCDFRNFSLSLVAANLAASCTGDVTLRYYLRLRDKRIPNPISPPEISPKITFRHAVEGASLVLQRTQ